MKRQSHRSAYIAALTLVSVVGSASAQQIVTYGAAEAGGAGSSLFLLGASAQPSGLGWRPMISAQVYELTFRTGANTTNSTVFAPSAGFVYQQSTSATQFRVGYAMTNSKTHIPSAVGTFPIAAESKNGVFTTVESDYWGTGAHSAQIIGTYNFADEFLWARVRGAQRMGGVDSPIMLGAEAGMLGGGTGTKKWGFFLGPTLRYKASKDLSFTGGVGYRAGTSNAGNGTGYAKLDFVYLIPLH